MSDSRPSNASRGFTLIELIAAIVVMAVAVPPMLWALRSAQRSRVTPVQISSARWLASEQLEDIIADRHSSTRGYDWCIDSNYPAESPVAGWTGFDRSVAIVETESDLLTAGVGHKVATVTVSWRNIDGDTRSLAVSTVLTEY